MERPDFNKLRRFSADIRIEAIKAFAEFGYGHVGGSISIADVLAVLFTAVLFYFQFRKALREITV